MNLIIAVAKTGDAAAIDALTKILTDGALHDSKRDYYLALVTYHRGQTNEARPKHAALADAPKLSQVELKTVAGVCADLKMTDERTKILHRLAAGGYGSIPRAEANADLARLHARAGDLKQAVAALGELQGAWGQALVEDAREAIANAITAENFPQFKGAVLDLVQKAPGHDRVSNLLGLAQQIAQRLGLPDTATRLAEEAKLTGVERAEAVAWDGLLEDWEIAGPYRGSDSSATASTSSTPATTSSRSSSSSSSRTSSSSSSSSSASFETVYPPEREALAKESERPATSTVTWKKNDPKQSLGIVRFGRVLGLNYRDLNGQTAYARTTLNSPEARVATFCLGSSDSVKVWVNGEEVHTSTDTRVCSPDQDRFSVPLKKGPNSLLLKVTNATDDWGFCLRIAEGKEELVLAGAR